MITILTTVAQALTGIRAARVDLRRLVAATPYGNLGGPGALGAELLPRVQRHLLHDGVTAEVSLRVRGRILEPMRLGPPPRPQPLSRFRCRAAGA